MKKHCQSGIICICIYIIGLTVCIIILFVYDLKVNIFIFIFGINITNENSKIYFQNKIKWNHQTQRYSYRFGPETADWTELEPSKYPVSG